MFTLGRRVLSNANRYANIAQSVAATSATLTKLLQPSLVRHCSYEGDGKTKVKVLNIDYEMGLMINSFSEASVVSALNLFRLNYAKLIVSFLHIFRQQDGFRLNTDFKVIGPMAIFPRMILAWNVDSVDDINEHSLRLFFVLEPQLDILVIGTGDAEVTPDVIAHIKAITQKYGLNVEILKTEAAVTTFNFLNAESRLVAAALIPPKKIKFNDMDLLLTQARHKELYGKDPLLEDQSDQILPKQ